MSERGGESGRRPRLIAYQDTVRRMAAGGVPDKAIALMLGFSWETIRQFRTENLGIKHPHRLRCHHDIRRIGE